MRILKNKVLASLLLIVGAVLVLEAGSRVMFTRADLMANPSVHFFVQDHPTRFWKQRPNIDVRISEHGSLKTNARGLRNGPVSVPAAEGVTRILSVGESSTWGQGVALEETYTKVIGRVLTERGWSVEAINAGVPAYSIWQVMVYLQEAGVDLEPDWIVVYSQANDFLPVRVKDVNRFLDQRTQTDRVLYEGRLPMAGLLRFLFQSRFFQVLRGPVLRSLPSERMSDSGASDTVRVPTEDRKLALARIIELCRDREIELVIVQPFYAVDRSQDKVLRDMAVENQVRFVNASHLRGEHSDRMETLFFDGVHPTAEGHALIGQLIADEIARR